MRKPPAIAIAAVLLSTAVTLRLHPWRPLEPWESVLLWNFRLPRLLMAAMIGSGMALSGWAAQKSTRNPLASPDMLAVSAAASLGVLLALTLGGAGLLSSRTLPAAAAASAILAAAILFGLTARRRRLDGSGLLLAGIALGSLISAAALFIAVNAQSGIYQYAIAIISGSLTRASWEYVWMLLPFWWLLTGAVRLAAPRIDLLAFEDDVVAGLGADAVRWRRFGLCLSAALGAVCTGIGGNFAFLGFVAPHIARRVAGTPLVSPWVVAGCGAGLLLAADAIGQVALRPAEAPAGIVTAIVGGPVFLAVLLRGRTVA
jgi:iron complex transport system permease protein